MTGIASVPNIFAAATTVLTPQWDANWAALVGYLNDPTNRVSFSADSGAINAYVLTPSPAIGGYGATSFLVWFIPINTNTGGSTANISGKGALTIYKDSATGPVVLTGGEIRALNMAGLFYDQSLNAGAGGFHLLNPAIQSGKVVQVVNIETGAETTGTTQIPFDNTIPQNTEGDQYMSLSITPQNAGSTLLIDIFAYFNLSGGSNLIAAIFQDSTASALATFQSSGQGPNFPAPIAFRHKMTAGTTSSTTLKLRAGPQTAVTVTFNGQLGSPIFGGTFASSMTITEISP